MLDQQFKNSEKEFILVALDGNNNTGGSFYVNSPVIGNWEDYVTTEHVSYIEDKYRTIAESNSRGIAGYSMGGFGALYCSLRHPDIFSSTLVFCPGIFAENDLDAVMDSWKGWDDVKKCYAQAFSPDTTNTKDYGNILTDSDIEAKNSVWKNWMDGYSNWNTKVDDYLALNNPLKSIMITYSQEDYFKWIPGGCEYLNQILKDKNVNYSTDQFAGGHIVPDDAIEKYFVPFFGENLSY
jgi:S-formylglutathione hydrolase FrmB